MTNIPGKVTMNTAISLAERGYRTLLRLYPRQHRAEYGVWMTQAFRDLCRDGYRQHGWIGLMEVWFRTLLDTLVTALHERRKSMFRLSWFRGSMVALLGGVLWLLGAATQAVVLVPFWERWRFKQFTDLGSLLIIPGLLCLLLTTGLLLYRYAPRMAAWGQWALRISITCGLIGLVLFVTTQIVRTLDNLWYVMLLFFLAHFIGWVVFGVGNLRWKVLPRWNILPLLIGLPFIAATVIQFVVLEPMATQRATDLNQFVFFLCYIIMGAALGLLGLALHAEVKAQPSV
jgi:hypothetical protein